LNDKSDELQYITLDKAPFLYLIVLIIIYYLKSHENVIMTNKDIDKITLIY